MDTRDPILITGAARSGTSMVAGVIDICGAWVGDTSGPNRSNQKGMFENVEIRNNIVKPYLQDLGVDKMGQYPLPHPEGLMIPRNFRDQIESVLRKQGYKDGPWMYKGAKMCLIWPVWHYAFPNAKWIIVRRKTSDIINSCCKTAFMRAFTRQDTCRRVGAKDEQDGWLWWVHQHEERFREMMDVGLNIKVVWPERMVNGDYQQIMDTIEWLGLEWQGFKIHQFIEPKLWKARRVN